jgi:tripartite-type tricarboxylate transporter receptor subunit TctC
MQEFVAWAKQTGRVNYGSGGVGSIGHIVGETFRNDAKLDLEHIGYKGSAPMHNDLVGGTIRFAVDTLPQNVPFARSGKLRMLAVTSPKRAAMAPDVPSVVELGMPHLVAENFFGVSAPAGLPRPIAERMHAAVMAALDDPKVRKTFEETGIDTRRMGIDEFSAFVSKQVADWAPAVKASGARLN